MGLNIKHKVIKLLEKKREKFQDLGQGKEFTVLIPMALFIKNLINFISSTLQTFSLQKTQVKQWGDTGKNICKAHI